ncbi:MAG: tRNA-dihydrouridine synthase [Candidatus Moranbacteria bacterium]|nr:tRNA-dihydrouridine synthase [Candidatus Moranbacteria bacterium]
MDDFWKKPNKPILALAPMAGITDSAFRELCRRHGAHVAYSEMASADALYYNPKKTMELLRFKESERPYVVQLFGRRPECFKKAAVVITKELRPDAIDINFGCPAKKVFGHGSGCALMPQKELAREIISAVCENTDLPVSIKIRAGIKETDAVDFIESTKDLPYSAVMVHARTYEGGFSGPLDFDIISKIKGIIPGKIVLANGGINTPQDGVDILRNHPDIDGLGIARGAWGRPYIFDEISEYLKTGKQPEEYGLERIKEIMIEHAELIWEDKKELGMFEIRKHLAWYIKGFPGAAKIREKLVLVNSVQDVKEILAGISPE